MKTIQDLFQQAQLAEAAYANFFSDTGLLLTNSNDVKAALISKGMSDTQATAFTDRYQVISQQSNTSSGFSSTLFLDKTTGQYTYAIRGTEGLLSFDLWVADAGIAENGLAAGQMVDMYNDWMRLNTPAGQSYQALVVESDLLDTAAYNLAIAGQFVPSLNMTADAYLQYINARNDVLVLGGVIYKMSFTDSTSIFTDGRQNGTGALSVCPAQMDVAGHSLGGNLAAAFTRMFPVTNADATTINGAGFPTGVIPSLGLNADTNLALFFSFTGGASSFNPAKIQNVHGDGIDFVSMNSQLGLVQQGAHQEIYIETVTPGLSNPTGNLLGHGATQMTDSLAVYNLLATIDPSLNTDPSGLAKITDILKAESSVAANTLESTINALGKLFVVGGTSFSSNEFDSNRDLLYSSIRDIVAALPTNGGLSLVAVDPATILTSAKADATVSPDALAYRYALVNGNPFVVTGADYGIHNTNGELDLFDPATRAGSLTNEYLADRANYLKWQLQANTQDKAVLTGERASTDLQYTDQASQGTLTVKGGLLASLNPARQIIFGSDGNDDGASSLSPVLQGGAADDRLYGMSGNDTLQGNGGNDYLEGGQGNDTYVWNTGDGKDTIRDTDGLGGIVINGQALGAGETRDGGRTYTSKDAAGVSHSYTVLSGDIHLAGGATLLIDGTIEVLNYRAGDLGLTLSDAPLVQTSAQTATSRDIIGDFGPMDFYDASGSLVYQYDDLGNLVTDPNKAGARDDVLHDGTGSDHVMSGAGNDVIYLNCGGDDLVDAGLGNDTVSKNAGGNVTVNLGDGADRLYVNAVATGTINANGGLGRDWIEGGSAADVLQGGMGADILTGGAGGDRLYGDSEISAEQAITNGNNDLASGLQGDWLSGNAGDDTLISREGNDVLAGGGGNDLLIAGAGDDFILGDAEYDAQSFDWSVTSQGKDAVFAPVTGPTNPIDFGNDIVYAGAGADRVWAGSGDDVVYGEGGNDQIDGQAGNDILMSGAGDDTVFGDGNLANTGDDYLDGGEGNDTLWGGNGNDVLIGGIGDDRLYGETGVNYLDGGDGSDILNSGGPGSTLMGGTGNDDITAVGGGNTLDGGVGDILNDHMRWTETANDADYMQAERRGA